MRSSERRQPDDIYSEILCKFIANLPSSERAPERLWLHYQKAYYYYIDIEKHKNKKEERQSSQQQRLEFFINLNRVTPSCLKIQPDQIERNIGYACDRIPVYGAILINQKKTKAVCIRKDGKHSFPKGKIDQGQTPITCAIRECWEETGYDITSKISAHSKIEITEDLKSIVFFVVYDVKEQSVKFQPQSVTEVDSVEWVSIDEYYREKLNRVTRKSFEKLQPIIVQKRAQKTKFESFLQSFRLELSNSANQPPPEKNPFENFQLDRSKLMEIFL